MTRRLLGSGVLLFLFSMPAFAQSESQTSRLERVAGYLSITEEVLYGKKATFEAEPDSLWRKAIAHYEILHGRQLTQTRLEGIEKNTKQLENLVFDVAKTLWGSNFVERLSPRSAPRPRP